MKLGADIKIIIAGALVMGGVVWWLARKGNAASVGAAVGGAAVDLITGAVSGVADATVAAANSDSNPLRPVGSWIGTTIYDATHSKSAGGWW